MANRMGKRGRALLKAARQRRLNNFTRALIRGFAAANLENFVCNGDGPHMLRGHYCYVDKNRNARKRARKQGQRRSFYAGIRKYIQAKWGTP